MTISKLFNSRNSIFIKKTAVHSQFIVNSDAVTSAPTTHALGGLSSLCFYSGHLYRSPVQSVPKSVLATPAAM